ncbi:hypothetical protein WDV93_10370 [Pantoea ananatis]
METGADHYCDDGGFHWLRQYRIIQPLKAMKAEGLVQGVFRIICIIRRNLPAMLLTVSSYKDKFTQESLEWQRRLGVLKNIPKSLN